MKGYRKYFAGGVKKHFPAYSDQIIFETDSNFQQIAIDTVFAARSANPIDKRLDFAAYFLAFIKTLDKRGESYETIRKISLEIVIDYVRPKNKFQRFLKRLPPKLIGTRVGTYLLKRFNERVNKNPNPDGFVANIVTDKKATFGFGYGIDITECGICKLFNKYNYQKYAAILCAVDAVTAEFAGLTMIRSGTIALGAKKCDFRWKKNDQF